MKLDTEDLAAIKTLIAETFSNVPLKVVTRFREGLPQVSTYYGEGTSYVMVRIRRMGGNLEIEWLTDDGERIAETLLRGV